MRINAISDHALLRWMQRKHGVDVEAWRDLMRADLAEALEAYEGRAAVRGPAFIVEPDGKAVATYVTSGWPISPQGGRIAIPAARASEVGA